MSNLVPKPIVDKNGVQTSRMVNPNKGENDNARANSAPAPTASVKRSDDVDSYAFYTEIEVGEFTDYFDVRDIESAFDTYATQLDEYIDQFDVDSSTEEARAIEFDEDDSEAIEEMKTEARKWSGIVQTFDNGEKITEPEGNSVKDWSDHLMNISRRWEAVQNNHGVTVINETYKAEYAQEFMEDTGSVPRDMPAMLSNNINWDGVADEMFRDSSSAEIDGKNFYLT